MLQFVTFSRIIRALGTAFGVAAFAVTAVPATAQSAANAAPTDVRALFASWEQSDRQRQGVMAIPSAKPVADYRLTSSFGTRSDPFRGSRRMHNGLDMAGPRGTPIYATADGVVGRAEWFSGYGKYIEINHGGGIETRYGHMSELLVNAGARVVRGQLIGRMGSTGRSTGSHLHYEVRIDGRPVNPVPFMRSEEYLASLPRARTPGETQIALGASQ